MVQDLESYRVSNGWGAKNHTKSDWDLSWHKSAHSEEFWHKLSIFICACWFDGCLSDIERFEVLFLEITCEFDCSILGQFPLKVLDGLMVL